ncbi:MAG: hypothetical protein CL915_09730 [Deltaproteobacteria bacterium]|nr:hypothetical protein [Deltaproteobacteria bacterium]
MTQSCVDTYAPNEKVAESWMGDFLQATHFNNFFYSAPIPHPPLMWSPLSQLGEIFLSFVTFISSCKW